MGFMGWIPAISLREYAERLSHDIATTILRTGPVPGHIAIIMDGNRRFAKQNRLQSGEGHFAGFEALMRVLRACSGMGVKVVTVYAFSIENFNRSPEESELLFNMIRTKMWDIVRGDEAQARMNGWKIRFQGNRSLLQQDIRERIAEMEDLTKNYTTMTVNICCPYTSRDDIAQAVQHTVEDLEEHKLEQDNLTLEDCEEHMYIQGTSPKLDILIRTSGETRLSDFMIWEANEECQVHFVSTLWPDFKLRELYKIILMWGYAQAKRKSRAVVHVNELPAAPPLISVTDVRNRK